MLTLVQYCVVRRFYLTVAYVGEKVLYIEATLMCLSLSVVSVIPVPSARRLCRGIALLVYGR